MGSQLVNVLNISVCLSVCVCIYFTCSKEHNCDRSVEASPGANADRHQGHQEGKEDKESSTQQQSQCGNLPVCIKSIHKNTNSRSVSYHITLHCMHYIQIIYTLYSMKVNSHGIHTSFKR